MQRVVVGGMGGGQKESTCDQCGWEGLTQRLLCDLYNRNTSALISGAALFDYQDNWSRENWAGGVGGGGNVPTFSLQNQNGVSNLARHFGFGSVPEDTPYGGMRSSLFLVKPEEESDFMSCHEVQCIVGHLVHMLP